MDGCWVKIDQCTTYPNFLEEFRHTLPLPYNSAPERFLCQVYSPLLIDLLVEQTNLYAAQREVAGWEDTTVYLGVVMATSIHQVSQLKNI